MSDPDPGPDHDPRLEQSGADHPQVQPGPTDLPALARTRRGLQVTAPGFLLVLVAAAVFPAGHAALTHVLLVGGWTLLTLGFLVMAPTPNGPLPTWLKGVYVLLFAGSAAHVGWRHLAQAGPADAWEARWHLVLWLLFLALPWILWRFCQHRGLNGRALTWLWGGLALLVIFALERLSGATWPAWLYAPTALALGANALLTARDVWDDGVWKDTRARKDAGAA